MSTKKIVIIISILAIIVTIILWYLSITPDFEIIIDPMQGSVQQGGTITTTITIKGIHGYKFPVSLSATEQPSDIIFTFAPPISEPKPSYTSTVTINVDKSVSSETYETRIKGSGADGKEHSCIYILTVNPTASSGGEGFIPTPTPTPTSTPTPTLFVIG